MTEDENVGWHHQVNGHGFGWTPGVGDGQGGLAGSWGCKESNTSERLHWTDLAYININLPQVYMLAPSLLAVTEHWLWVSCSIHQTPTGYLIYTWYCICFSAIMSNHPTLSFSHWVQKSVLYNCVSSAVLHAGLSVLFFYIPYICVSIQYLFFSFWLSLLSIIGSTFIHLIRIFSNVFLLIAE